MPTINNNNNINHDDEIKVVFYDYPFFILYSPQQLYDHRLDTCTMKNVYILKEI